MQINLVNAYYKLTSGLRSKTRSMTTTGHYVCHIDSYDIEPPVMLAIYKKGISDLA